MTISIDGLSLMTEQELADNWMRINFSFGTKSFFDKAIMKAIEEEIKNRGYKKPCKKLWDLASRETYSKDV